MFTFILICESSTAPSSAGIFLDPIGRPRKEPGDRFVLEEIGGMKNGWAAVVRVDAVASEYEEDDMLKIKGIFRNPAFFIFEGRDVLTRFSDRCLFAINDSLSALIDNDHGLIERVSVFKKLAANGKDWLHTANI